MTQQLRVAALGYEASGDILANAHAINEAITEAASGHARVLVTPEAALTGYPGVHREDLEHIDWKALDRIEDELAENALERGIVLILVSASPFDNGIGNDALICGAVPKEQRYRTRCLTMKEQRSYVPGTHNLTVEVDDWLIGVSVSFDIRFPWFWEDLAKKGCHAFMLLSHVAGHEETDAAARRSALPAHCVSRAAEWVTPLVVANTAAADRWLDTAAWDGQGAHLAGRANGLLIVDLPHRDSLSPFYQDLRGLALARRRREST